MMTWSSLGTVTFCVVNVVSGMGQQVLLQHHVLLLPLLHSCTTRPKDLISFFARG
jgi:hypothetical protein